MKQRFRKKFSWLFTLAISALVVIPFAAFADQLHGDDLTTNGDTTKVPEATGTAKYFLQATGPDKCNASKAFTSVTDYR